jgi:hypothetical protein
LRKTPRLSAKKGSSGCVAPGAAGARRIRLTAPRGCTATARRRSHVSRTDLGIRPDLAPSCVVVCACRLRIAAPDASLCRTYFRRRAPERFAARKEIPARMAFCCTAAAVRPSFLAT